MIHKLNEQTNRLEQFTFDGLFVKPGVTVRKGYRFKIKCEKTDKQEYLMSKAEQLSTHRSLEDEFCDKSVFVVNMNCLTGYINSANPVQYNLSRDEHGKALVQNCEYDRKGDNRSVIITKAITTSDKYVELYCNETIAKDITTLTQDDRSSDEDYFDEVLSSEDDVDCSQPVRTCSADKRQSGIDVDNSPMQHIMHVLFLLCHSRSDTSSSVRIQ